MIKKFSENLIEPTLPSVANGNYVLIGGTLGRGVYQEMLRLTGKEKAHVLYIGMAADDPEAGISGIEVDFGAWLGCTSDCLTLKDLEDGTAARKIEEADIIYVDGGSSRMMLARLKKHGTDALLRKAAANGTVVGGSSAGAICFGALGSSSVGYDRFMNLKAAGCVDIVVCPHGLETLRVEKMKEYLLDNPTMAGVAVDFAALEISGGNFRIYSEEDIEESHGVRYWVEDGQIFSEDINSMEWRPISELYK